MRNTRPSRRFAAPSLALIPVLIFAAQTPRLSAPSTIAAALEPFVENKTVAGAVALIASPERILGVEAIGYADIAARKPMREDSLFWVASMSKPITASALMMLVGEGKVNIDDPVEKYLPEFKGQWLAVEKDSDHVLLKKPAHPIAVRNILTHTSGLPHTSALEQPSLDLFPLAARVRSYAMSPLGYPPDSKYQYSNAGINTAGRIVEVVSGMPYEEFLQRRLFDPLGMKDTTFWPTGGQLSRIAKSYRADLKKKDLEELQITQLRYPLDGRTRQPMPAGGLFSTARDMGRFCQMVLGGGVFGGKRYLTAPAVQQMTSIQTGDLVVGDGATGYGLGWSVLRHDATGDGRSAGCYGHSGAYKTAMWVDPQRKLIMVLLVQHSGDYLTPDGNRIGTAFFKAAIEKYGKAQ
jgi:CubicO group peptidase (beta-lactamase class C family)